MRKFLSKRNGQQLLWIALVLIITSCKSTKVVTGGAVDEKLSAKGVIKAQDNGAVMFK